MKPYEISCKEYSALMKREITDLVVQAFTHPLRLRLLTLLRLDGPLTASELARRRRYTVRPTSYHLRQLERFGFVVGAADAGSAANDIGGHVGRPTRPG